MGPKSERREITHTFGAAGLTRRGFIPLIAGSELASLSTGNLYKAIPRFGECCRQVEAEEVSNSRNKIYQTMCKDFFGLFICLPVKEYLDYVKLSLD